MSSYKFKGHEPVVHETVFVAPNATLVGKVELCENSSVWYGAILRADIAEIKIGKGSNIQDGSIVHVDFDTPCIVGDNVTVGHGCILHACTVGNNARIGMGAILLNGAVVEDGAQVAAGSLVPPGKTVKANSLYVGLPAKKFREHTEKESEDIRRNAAVYSDLAQDFKKVST
jgi:carbonic anhydrase/acetyltransferase-like protein (isoleucine patch superfamily)